MDKEVINSQMPPDDTTPDFEPLVKAPVLERAVSVSRYKLYALVRANKIPHYKVDRSVRFRISEIVAWMKKK